MPLSFAGVIHYSRLKDRLATHFVPFAEFEKDTAAGTLPDFSFIEPNMLSGHGDYHPAAGRSFLGDNKDIAIDTPSSVLGGEALLARVFNAYRGATSETGSNVWNTTLLIGWDEPGGTYDHVPPGPAAPPDPTAPPGEMGFQFDRSGYRVPAILVSPWVEPGSVYNDEYRHTSLIATLRKTWELGDALSQRDASARTFDHLSTWDVAELQFLLAWDGFPSGRFNGRFSWHVAAAVKRFQRNTGLPADGIDGAQTLRALRTSPIAVCPMRLTLPVAGWLSSPYGPRWLSFHPGIDLAAPKGTPVVAAASGRVTWAGARAGGWGRLIVVQSSQRIAIFYAHLSKTDVSLGQHVKRGTQIGLVGSTGNSTGPHLYLEVRVNNAAVDPLPVLRPLPTPPRANT